MASIHEVLEHATIDQKLELMGRVGESMDYDAEPMPISEWDLALLKERRREIDEGDAEFVVVEVAIARIRQKFGISNSKDERESEPAVEDVEPLQVEFEHLSFNEKRDLIDQIEFSIARHNSPQLTLGEWYGQILQLKLDQFERIKRPSVEAQKAAAEIKALMARLQNEPTIELG